MSKLCQSCSMPLNKDAQGGGTNADGSINRTYCSFCFKDGAFTNPDLTAADMQKFCIDILRKQGMPGFVGWILTRTIPNLERWKKH